MKNTIKYALFGAVLALVTPVFADAPDCYKMSVAIKKAIAAQPDKVLELVAAQVAQNESCACEVVKAAIVATDADKKLVANIVDAAVTSAPSKVRVIGQCAVAVAPDALAEVQAVVVKMDSIGASVVRDGNGYRVVGEGVVGDGRVVRVGKTRVVGKGAAAVADKPVVRVDETEISGKDVVGKGVVEQAPDQNPLDFPGFGGGAGGFILIPPTPPIIIPPISTDENVVNHYVMPY